MSELSGADPDRGEPYPWEPSEIYLSAYEQYLSGVTDELPTVPDGLTFGELEEIAVKAEYMEFQLNNESLMYMSDEDVFNLFLTLHEIRDLPEATDLGHHIGR